MTDIKKVTLEEELKKNPDLNLADLKQLQQWMSKQPHLPAMTDEELVLFLHSCFYRIEQSKQTVDLHFTVRTHVPEFFANRDPNGKDLKQALQLMYDLPLPKATPEGYRVILVQIGDSDATRFDFIQAIKSFFLIMDIWLLTEGTAPGHIIVFDMTNVNLGHLARLTIMGMKKLLYYLQEGLPVRLKGLHFVNVVPFMDKILAMMKPFMKKELMDVLYLHTDVGKLYEFVPQNVFPMDYGGEAPTKEELHDHMLNLIDKHQKWIALEETRRVNESKRPGKSKNAGDLFGVEGSFKKLEID